MEQIRIFVELKVNVNLLLVYFLSSPPLEEIEFKCEDYCLKIKTKSGNKLLKLDDKSLCLIPSRAQFLVASEYSLLRLELQPSFVKTTSLLHNASKCYEFERIVALNAQLQKQPILKCECGTSLCKITRILPRISKQLQDHGFVGRCVEGQEHVLYDHEKQIFLKNNQAMDFNGVVAVAMTPELKLKLNILQDNLSCKECGTNIGYVPSETELSLKTECVLLYKQKISLLDLSTPQSLTTSLLEEFNIVAEREKSMLVFVDSSSQNSILIKANVDETKILETTANKETQKLEERKKVYYQLRKYADIKELKGMCEFYFIRAQLFERIEELLRASQIKIQAVRRFCAFEVGYLKIY